ncbi:MAG: hypothetical protein R2875_09130 [Desulfobacterales bacterium]
MATIEDITAQKQAKAALQSSIKRLRQTAARLFPKARNNNIAISLRIWALPPFWWKKYADFHGQFQIFRTDHFTKKEITNIKRLSEFIDAKAFTGSNGFTPNKKKKDCPCPQSMNAFWWTKTEIETCGYENLYALGQHSSIISFFDITKGKKRKRYS